MDRKNKNVEYGVQWLENAIARSGKLNNVDAAMFDLIKAKLLILKKFYMYP